MKIIRYAVALSVAFLGWSCQPEPSTEELIDQLVVSTNYDNTVNFGSYATYTVREDTIGFVSNYTSDPEYLDTDYARQIIAKATTNMNTRGFTKVDPDQDPDVAVNIYIVRNLDVFQQVIYPGYGGYGGYYYPYGSYYYYPYINTQIYDTAVLIIELIDLKNVNSSNEVKVVWNAYMGDLIAVLNLEQQTYDAIDQAFVQSPYIVK